MIKKVARRIIIFMVLFSTLFLTMSAELQTAELYRYIKNADGSYSYNEEFPVFTYDGSAEKVQIPTSFQPKKFDFRSSWVATVSNLNMPAVGSENQFQEEYLKILDEFESWKMNAMIFQVRPMLDAYYESELNPWSAYLSGKQGENPGYNPLPWMIEQTKMRGMEYHAWLNPYRVTNIKVTDPSILQKSNLSAEEMKALTIQEQLVVLKNIGILAENNFAVKHPHFVLQFDEKFFLNPGEPDVLAYVINSVKEIVQKYDVDAIHFDDYFYPYRISVNGQNVFFGQKNEDRETFEKYGLINNYPDTNEGIEAWRRDNITALVNGVKECINNHNIERKKSVQFGISPFGIWEHIAYHPEGSNTPIGSSESYSKSIYADTKRWIEEETLDYVIPQIYWSFDQKAAPYGELTQWWSRVAEKSRTQLYIGHANYKHVSNGGWEAAWMNPEEVPNQLKYNQMYPVEGSVLFSYNDLKKTDLSMIKESDRPKHQVKNQSIDILKQQYFQFPVLVPAKPWLDYHQTTPISDAHFSDDEQKIIKWSDEVNEDVKLYVIYRGNGDVSDVVMQPQNIIAKIPKLKSDGNQYIYDLNAAQPLRHVATNNVEQKYYVSVIDYANNETAAVQIKTTAETITEPEGTLSPQEQINELVEGSQQNVGDQALNKRLVTTGQITRELFILGVWSFIGSLGLFFIRKLF